MEMKLKGEREGGGGVNIQDGKENSNVKKVKTQQEKGRGAQVK